MDTGKFFIYLAVMAGVTYAIRMLPLVLIKKKIENRFILSVLYYMPYAVLAAMTIPSIFFSTGSLASAAAGLVCALVLAFFDKGLLTVALGASAGALITEIILKYFVK